ncbi:glycosyltransferase family 4 protein [Desulfosporosinus hippei]|uniref:Glycosyltransferase involved in cell wall bisynthesis n=1 Tax=Desulfosporosinus hippei DSM 8344 TaxID=1121419 RepID=A0A1G8IAG2_9FIRM|nr:glycosyltransferase family 4 protein [Desulfosporosinus hippei]SDI15560.1 Glycosyltransferase involved in cell wall bisynthesis [Desulfosporosinus hippei DSM 8344]
MDNKLAIFIPNLINWDGEKQIIGGLERYMIALAEIMTEMGYDLSFHQFAHHDFSNNSLDWPVYGYQADSRELHKTIGRMEKATKGRVLYSSIVQQTSYRPQSICISHGVWWELPGSSPVQAQKYYENHVAKALEQAGLIISCDYNFLNVTRAIYPHLADQKIRVIPNFADSKYYYPRKPKNTDHVRILYPRRLSPERGFGILKEVIPPLLCRFPQVEFEFAIDTNKPEYLEIFHQWRENLTSKERILYCHPDYQSMPEVYAEADIVVIPSIYSEGTSFSCLEAMAMGKAVIATDVGGLTNLIINGYNGLLIHPSKESLYQSLLYLIENPSVCTRFGEYAYTTSQAFSRRVWEARWRQCIKRIYPLS